ncbi:NMD3 family-domain-containing protein [Neocallimastix lanati (nom. inval.)]|nr:NMD3 family-domain-containing protein [Neocallimastix sp. JGI-2020a]
MDYEHYNPTITGQTILCCNCGVPITPNPANMCIDCIRNEVDITEGIPKQCTLNFCRSCERYLQPPNLWVYCQLESRELLALCLKRLKGLNKVRLINAQFIFTEPHSKRIKLQLTIQKEVFANTILQQVFVVTFLVCNQICEDCTDAAAKNTWKACVQVRQKVNHKRTFFFLEQLILKHNAQRDANNIKEAKDGIDFYYSQRSHAIKMLEFLQSVAPLRVKTSEQLLSADVHTGNKSYKFTYSCELIPICKDDLLCLPKKVAHSASMIDQLCICYKINNSIQIIDPNTMKIAEIRPQAYWQNAFSSLCSYQDLVEYYIIDVLEYGPRVGKFQQITVEVALSNDFSNTFIARTHLGNILKAGDHAFGYNLVHTNFNDPTFENYSRSHNIPDVVLVKKSYPSRRKRVRARQWKLKELSKEEENNGEKSKAEVAKAEQDYELFLRDIEEDPELRGMINLYKNPNANNNNQDDEMIDESEAEEDFPEIQLEELLDELTLEDKEDVEME